MTTKIDYKKELKTFYNPPQKDPVIVDVPPMNFLMIDGKGDPNTAREYQDAMTTIYTVAYTIKFAVKGTGTDFVVMPLEGLWWVPDMDLFSVDDKNAWLWTAMIMQPDPVTVDVFEEAVEQARQKKNPPSIDKIRFEQYDEGTSVQLMHIGPYADEAPNIERMHAYAFDQGYTLRGKHHEIYLSDPNRTAPERLKTVIRQPIEKAK
ncbi:MAG: GyrI-like domain-containing protein [Anaerolineales bacterium]|jgi:hypothetical protein